MQKSEKKTHRDPLTHRVSKRVLISTQPSIHARKPHRYRCTVGRPGLVWSPGEKPFRAFLGRKIATSRKTGRGMPGKSNVRVLEDRAAGI